MGFSESIARRDPGIFDDVLWREAGGDAQLFTLLKGLIARESAWNVGAFRWEPAMNEGSIGLMQVLPSTAREAIQRPDLTTSDLFVPEINIAAGAAYLRYQISRYRDARRAVSAYNCGSECLTRPTSFWPNGNAAYADDVLTYQSWYLNQLQPRSAEPYTPTSTEEPLFTDETPTDFLDLSTLGVGIGVLALGLMAAIMLKR